MHFIPLVPKSQMADIHVDSIDKKSKFSRKRLNEDEGDITYINERNRVFNKKVIVTSSFALVAPIDISIPLFRLHDTMTSIPPRSGLASNGALPCSSSVCVVFICISFVLVLSYIIHALTIHQIVAFRPQ